MESPEMVNAADRRRKKTFYETSESDQIGPLFE
jgi:hypothetical protein